MRTFGKVVSLAAFAFAASFARAAIVLDFEGIGDLVPVGNFYNGGGGPNYGVSFSPNAWALVDSDAGGSGYFGGEPSPSTVIFYSEGGAVTLNCAAGFTTGFSFFYTSPNYPGSVTVWDGLDGTGTLLATLGLPLTPYNGAPDPTGAYSPLVPIGVTFSGVARSVDLGGTPGNIAFDNVTLGSATPGGVPDAGSTALMLLGSLLSLLAFARRK